MGREIRRVPANWEHPKRMKYDFRKQCDVESYQPLYDRGFRGAMREWVDEWEAWERGERSEYYYAEDKDTPYWEYAGAPPDPQYYRPEWNEEDQTWWQVYETVSEGTPVTPPFATREELVEYLVANGDFWDQKRREEGPSFGFQMPCATWSRDQAMAFVFGDGFAVSLVVQDGKVMSGVEFLTQK